MPNNTIECQELPAGTAAYAAGRLAPPLESARIVSGTTTAGVTNTAHFGYIDALRGLAFLAVLAVHAGDRVQGLPALLRDVLGRGYVGVQLFFVVSAFTLCLSLGARANDAAPFRAYFLRRAFRIVPMFWCAIALYLAIYGFSAASPRWGIPDGMTGQQLGLAVFLLHGFNTHAINGVVPGGWSVATETQFYLILPLMLFWASSLRRAVLLWVATLALSIIALPALEFLLAPQHAMADRDIVHRFAFYALPTQFPVFCCGLILYRLMGPDRAALARLERWLPASPHRRAVLIVVAVALIGLPLRLTAWPPGLVGRWFPGHLGYGVLAALLTYALATWPLDLLVNPVSRFLGRISYSGYLLHFLMLDQVETLVGPPTASRPLLHLVLLGGGALALTVAASAVTFAAVEQPGIALGRSLIAWLAARPAQRVLASPS